MNFIQLTKFIVRERGGFWGLYRGIAPGSIRSFIGNGNFSLKNKEINKAFLDEISFLLGCGMVIMQFAQKKVTEYGLRK